MNIVKVGYHCCIRLVKEAIALKKQGHTVHLIGFKKPSKHEIFDTFTLCRSTIQLHNAIKVLSHNDIFHVHNEPNWLVPAVREVTDKPIVFDVHDSMQYRSDDEKHKSCAERFAFELSDAFVFVSGPCRDISLHAHPKQQKKPSIVLPPYVNEDFIKYRDWAWVGGLVYQGLMSTDKNPPYMQYANYKDFVKKTVELNLPFHVYTSNINDYFKEYYEGAIIEGSATYHDLMNMLGHYDWGVLGNLGVYKDWNVAFPNKLFEYMAAGIPIVALNSEYSGKFIEEHGIGIAVSTLEELKARWSERALCQRSVFKKRWLFTMEKHIHLLESLYKVIK